jgi:parallel beta-helix repeat protein
MVFILDILKKKIFFIFFCFAINAQSINLYVSTSGDDANSGTSLSMAFSTIQKAHDLSNPGDIINVADGLYTSGVTITRSGTSGNWITYKSINQYGAKIIDSWNSCFNIGNVNLEKVENVGYIIIDGFDVTATYDYAAGILSDWGAHHITIQNCWVHDCGASGISLGHGDYLIIKNNICNHNSTLFGELSGSGISIYGKKRFDLNPGYHIIIKGNICYNNVNGPLSPQSDGNGIIIDDLRCTQIYHTIFDTPIDINYTDYKVLVENNLCYANEGAGIQSFLSNNITIRNNTVFNNQLRRVETTWRGELTASCCKNVVFANNIAVANSSLRADGGSTDWADFSYNTAIGAYALDGNEYGSNYLYYNNITFDKNNTTSNSISITGIEIILESVNGNKCATNPKFIDPSLSTTSNFRLKPISPAINSGTLNYGISATDLDKAPRLQNGIVDMGCYEFISPVPKVSIVAQQLNASETGTINRLFKVSRTGIKNEELIIYYNLVGTAANSLDYQFLSGSVIIPIGSAFATINLIPIDDTVVENTESAIAIISNNNNYIINSEKDSAFIKIIDNDLPEAFSELNKNINEREQSTIIEAKLKIFSLSKTTEFKEAIIDFQIQKNEEEKNINISIHPNPSSEIATIDYNLMEDSKVMIALFDNSGKKIKTIVNDTKLIGLHSEEINTKTLSSGSYFIHFRLNTKEFVKQLIVNK